MDVFFIMFFVWFVVFLFSGMSFFVFLIVVEGLMLSVFYGLLPLLSYSGESLSVVVLFLSMVVMEGGVGLSLLVLSVSWYGSDNVFLSYFY